MPQATIQVFRDAGGRAPLIDWLAELESNPRSHAKCLERILRLSEFGNELRRPIAGYLRDGIYELRAESGNVQYRLLYFFHGRNAVVLSHGLTKKKKVPAKEIDRAVKNKRLVEQDPKLYLVEWDI